MPSDFIFDEYYSDLEKAIRDSKETASTEAVERELLARFLATGDQDTETAASQASIKQNSKHLSTTSSARYGMEASSEPNTTPPTDSNEGSKSQSMDIDTHSPSYSPPTSRSEQSALSEMSDVELEELRQACQPIGSETYDQERSGHNSRGMDGQSLSEPSSPGSLSRSDVDEFALESALNALKVPKWPGENESKVENFDRFKRSTSGTLYVYTGIIEEGRKVFIRADDKKGRRWLGPGRKSVNTPKDENIEDDYIENPALTEAREEFERMGLQRRRL